MISAIKFGTGLSKRLIPIILFENTQVLMEAITEDDEKFGR